MDFCKWTINIIAKLTLDQTIQNFKIRRNVEDFDAFGEFVIEVEVVEKGIETRITYAFSNNYESIYKIEKLAELRKKYCQEEIFFCIFTTIGAYSVQQEYNKFNGTSFIEETKYLGLLNVTNDSRDILVFDQSLEEMNENQHIYIFTRQIPDSKMLENLLKEYFLENKSSSWEIQTFWKSLSKKISTVKTVLEKKTVITMMEEIFLRPYLALPARILKAEGGRLQVWNDIMEKVDLIVMKNENFIVSKIYGILFSDIERKNGTAICIRKLPGSLWNEYSNIPLVLSLVNKEDDEEHLLRKMNFIKYSKRRLILITNNPSFFRDAPCDLTIFNCLEDVKEFVDMKNIPLKITDDFIQTLDEIQSWNCCFLQRVSPNMFLDMLLGKFNLADNKNISGMIITLGDKFDKTSREKRKSQLNDTQLDDQNDIPVVTEENSIKLIQDLDPGGSIHNEEKIEPDALNPIRITYGIERILGKYQTEYQTQSVTEHERIFFSTVRVHRNQIHVS